MTLLNFDKLNLIEYFKWSNDQYSMNNHLFVRYSESLKGIRISKRFQIPKFVIGEFYIFLRRVWLYWIGFVPELGQGVALKLDDLVDFHKYQTLDSHQLKTSQWSMDQDSVLILWLDRIHSLKIPACWTEEAKIIEVNNNSIWSSESIDCGPVVDI